MFEGRRQRAEVRRQRSEVRRQRSEVRRQRSEVERQRRWGRSDIGPPTSDLTISHLPSPIPHLSFPLLQSFPASLALPQTPHGAQWSGGGGRWDRSEERRVGKAARGGVWRCL